MKLRSKLPNLVKKFQSAFKIWTKCRLNFHEVECTPKGDAEVGVAVFLPFMVNLKQTDLLL